MKRTFRNYTIIWAILLALFNVITFISPNEAEGMTKFGGAFWAGYVLITLAFVGQLAVSYNVFRSQDNAQRFFYRVPLITISWAGLILTVVVGAVCMIIPDLPNWLGAIICLVVLGFNAISLAKADAAAELVTQVDSKIKVQTFFIKDLTVEAEGLVVRATADEIKAECKKVYEAVRYSDPMSNDALSGVESQISIRFAALADSVKSGDAAAVAEAAREVTILLSERNDKCKLLK